MQALKAAANHADPLEDLYDDAHIAAASIPATLERKNAGSAPAAAPTPAGDADLRAVVAEMGRVLVKTATSVQEIHEHYKSANDEALKQESKGKLDPITDEKRRKINAALDDAGDEAKRIRREQAIKSARPGMGRPAETAEQKSKRFVTEWKAAADHYMRTGDETQIRAFQAKAMSAGVNADGGYTVFAEQERSILDKLLVEVSPMRQLATVQSISTSQYTKPFGLGGADSGWVGETVARPATATSQLALLTYSAFECYANPGITQQLLDDSAVDLESWHAGEVVDRFAQQEGVAFHSGNGTSQPKGFLVENKVANSAWAHGSLGFIATGAAADFGASPLDNIMDLIYAVKAGHRMGAQFMFNRAIVAKLRKVKDTTGEYIWKEASGDQPSKLLGYPVVESEDMPGVGANAFPVAFGNFKRGYLIVDRKGVNVLRDPYTNKPFVHFYTTKRVGGGVQNFEAIKLLKCSV